MNKVALLIGVVVIVLLALGGVYLYRPSTSISAPITGVEASKVEVILSDSGFSPANFNVKQGTTVTFINQSAAKCA